MGLFIFYEMGGGGGFERAPCDKYWYKRGRRAKKNDGKRGQTKALDHQRME